jgi:hypothetical protein
MQSIVRAYDSSRTSDRTRIPSALSLPLDEQVTVSYMRRMYEESRGYVSIFSIVIQHPQKSEIPTPLFKLGEMCEALEREHCEEGILTTTPTNGDCVDLGSLPLIANDKCVGRTEHIYFKKILKFNCLSEEDRPAIYYEQE